jgi:hypothetical protein
LIEIISKKEIVTNNDLWIPVIKEMPKPGTECVVSVKASNKTFDIKKMCQICGDTKDIKGIANAYYNKNEEWELEFEDYGFFGQYDEGFWIIQIAHKEPIDVSFKHHENVFLEDFVRDRKYCGITTKYTKEKQVIVRIYVEIEAWFPCIYIPYGEHYVVEDNEKGVK